MRLNLFKPIGYSGNIGVDIGTSSIKMVELEKRGGRFMLKNYGMFELKGANNINSGDQSDEWQSILKMPDSEISDGLREVRKRAKMEPTSVIASIPSFSTFATVIEMPYVSNEDLARALPFEAKKYIPIPLNDVVLDWSIVGIVENKKNNDKSEKNNLSMVEVFLAAVPKDETSRYQTIMKNAGLRLQALELENSALIRAILGNDLSTAAIINIGGRSTSIIIVSRGYERISHNYEIGGFEITRAISRSLNISLEKAEELKRKFGLGKSEENIINESMTSLIDMMVFETQKTIAGYEESKGEKIGSVILIGGLTNMPGFSDYFKGKLGRNVIIGNPFSRVVYSKELEPLIPELKSTLAIASGLAMREV